MSIVNFIKQFHNSGKGGSSPFAGKGSPSMRRLSEGYPEDYVIPGIGTMTKHPVPSINQSPASFASRSGAPTPKGKAKAKAKKKSTRKKSTSSCGQATPKKMAGSVASTSGGPDMDQETCDSYYAKYVNKLFDCGAAQSLQVVAKFTDVKGQSFKCCLPNQALDMQPPRAIGHGASKTFDRSQSHKDISGKDYVVPAPRRGDNDDWFDFNWRGMNIGNPELRMPGLTTAVSVEEAKVRNLGKPSKLNNSKQMNLLGVQDGKTEDAKWVPEFPSNAFQALGGDGANEINYDEKDADGIKPGSRKVIEIQN